MNNALHFWSIIIGTAIAVFCIKHYRNKKPVRSELLEQLPKYALDWIQENYIDRRKIFTHEQYIDVLRQVKANAALKLQKENLEKAKAINNSETSTKSPT